MKYLFLTFIASSLLLSSCEDKTTDTVDASEVLTEYLKTSSMDLADVIGTKGTATFFVMGAPADGNLDAKWIMDIRSAADFAKGHIVGANNVAFPDILSSAANADKPILVVCYTGQTACFATTLLRLYGYESTQALKWGMSGWNSEFSAKWDNSVADIVDGNPNWSYASAPSNSVYELPSFNNLAVEGVSLLKERVEAVVAEGFKTVSASDVLTTPSDYQVNNFFSEAHYNLFGHIKDANRINPLLLTDGSIKGLNPDAKVVTYCYTGQTSAVVTAFLRVLGYDAHSLSFGMNALSNNNAGWGTPEDAVTNQWGVDSKPKSLSTVK